MESTTASTSLQSSQGLISQNLTLQQLKKKTLPANMVVRLGTSISKGAFGTVYTADIFERTQQKAAMKIIRRAMDNRGQYQEIDQYNLIEIEIMSQIDNPFINKLIDFYFQHDQDSGQEELVLLQPLAMCDLSKFLEENYPEGRMSESMAIEFLAQLAIGTKAMHDKKVIHRDLNPRNILVFKDDQKSALNNQEFILKISDFGCSKILGYHQERTMTQGIGKINYMAPEQFFQSEQGYNSSVDVQYKAQEQLIEGLQKKFPPHIIQARLKKPLKQSIPEIGRVLYQMARVWSQQKSNQNERQAQYELAIGNNENRLYGRYYERDTIKEGDLRNGQFDGEACLYGINSQGYNYYYDGEYVDGSGNGYGVMISSDVVTYMKDNG
eukprot:403341687